MFEDPRLLKCVVSCVLLLAFALTLGITMLKIELKRRREDKITDWEFIVDITKPPIFPPNISLWDGMCETGKSKRRTADWERYMVEYERASNATRPNK